MTPISLTTRGSGLYAALRQYKGRPNSITERRQARLGELLGAWFERHLSCVAPRGVDLVTVVPSMRVPTEVEHPLATVLRAVGCISAMFSEAIVTAERHSGIERNRPDPGAYACASQAVKGKRVLLVDDTYTTGAHLHSAAATLEDTGAATVALVVIGRHQQRHTDASRRLLEWSAAHPWDSRACVRCRNPGERVG